MEPAPRSLILDLLATVGRGAAPVRALVAAAELFGIAQNSLRVALARLLAEGLVERDARGCYRLGPRAQAVSQEIRSWRHLEERIAPWGGSWIGVHAAGSGGRSPRARRDRARALRLLGFRTLTAGLELRPDNLRGGVAATRERLSGLGLGEPALVFGLAELEPESDRRARQLWRAGELVAGYRATREALEASAARLLDLPRATAMCESFRLGGAAIRQLVFDPLLPEAIVPAAERRALVETIIRYDRLGRRVWTGWLGGEAEEPAALPVGVRGNLSAEARVLRIEEI